MPYDAAERSTVLSSLSRHTLRQLKFILPGSVITYYLDSHVALWQIVQGKAAFSNWARTVALASLGSGIVTVVLFVYVLLLPLIQGQEPNYRHWRESGVLSSVIPTLTASIVIGWLLLSYTFARWSDLGYVEGIIASSGLYALCFGLLGLIPAPKVQRR